MRNHRRATVIELGCAAFLALLSATPVQGLEQATAFTRALDKGEALMDEGKYSAAIGPLKKAERLSAEPSRRVLTNLAVSFNSVAGGGAEAESYARAALGLAEQPIHRAGALNQLGLALLSTTPQAAEKLEEAARAFEGVLELTGGQPIEARYNLGEALRRQNRFPEARTAFEEILTQQPDGELAARAKRAIDWSFCMETAGPKPPLELSEDLGNPVKISGSGIGYTPEARQARIQGTVILQTMIDAEGSVRCPFVLRGLPAGLSELAVKTVTGWKFEPATLNGEPVAVTYIVTLNFRLGN